MQQPPHPGINNWIINHCNNSTSTNMWSRVLTVEFNIISGCGGQGSMTIRLKLLLLLEQLTMGGSYAS